jgi:hypothetical protein
LLAEAVDFYSPVKYPGFKAKYLNTCKNLAENAIRDKNLGKTP